MHKLFGEAWKDYALALRIVAEVIDGKTVKKPEIGTATNANS